MFKFSSGLIIGIILSTVGVNGIVKLSDNILNNVQNKTREATYSQNQNQQQPRQVPPNIPSNQNQQQSSNTQVFHLMKDVLRKLVVMYHPISTNDRDIHTILRPIQWVGELSSTDS